ncbi:hypothetical protein NBRC116595_17820 [Aliiglaciecola sp. NS0011-25]
MGKCLSIDSTSHHIDIYSIVDLGWLSTTQQIAVFRLTPGELDRSVKVAGLSEYAITIVETNKILTMLVKE